MNIGIIYKESQYALFLRLRASTLTKVYYDNKR